MIPIVDTALYKVCKQVHDEYHEHFKHEYNHDYKELMGKVVKYLDLQVTITPYGYRKVSFIVRDEDIEDHG